MILKAHYVLKIDTCEKQVQYCKKKKIEKPHQVFTNKYVLYAPFTHDGRVVEFVVDFLLGIMAV